MRTSSQSPAFVAVTGLLAALYAVHALGIYYVSDDGFISFRYAQNLLRGHGLVYNVGERVEGYTNFLWVMMLAAAQWLLPSAGMPHIAQVLGVILGMCAVVVVSRFGAWLPPQRPALGALAAACLAAQTCFAAWGTGGLETTLVALLLLIGATSYVRHLYEGRGLGASAFAFALATLARPDAGLFFAVTTLHLVTAGKARGAERWRQLATWLAIYAAVFVPYFIWRYTYYGYLLPNTFYAKVGSGWRQYIRGGRYTASYLWSAGLVAFVPALVRCVSRPRAAWRDYFVLLVGAYVAYIAYVGGDGLFFFRFFAFIAPLVALLLADGLLSVHDTFGARGGVVRGLVGASILLLAQGSLGPLLLTDLYRWREPQSGLTFPGRNGEHSYYWFDNYFVDRLAIAAHWLQANAPPTSVVAATPGGSIAYHMDARVIEMLGLTDATIAHTPTEFGAGRAGHEKGNGAYVLSRRPDYILLGNVAVLPMPIDDVEMPRKLVHRSEHEIWAAPEFHRDYEHVTIKLSDTGVFRYFTFYQRKTAIAATSVLDATLPRD